MITILGIMKTVPRISRLLALSILVVCSTPAMVIAASTTPPQAAIPSGLSFAEIKITGDEFVVIQNNSASTIPDLSVYWLDDFNNVNPLSAGVSSSTQQLPTASLSVGQSLLLSAAPMATCNAAVAGKLGLSLTDSGGFLQLVQMGQNSVGAVTQTPGDVVNWNSGTSGLIQNVPSSTKDPRAMYYRYFSGSSYVWQQADTDPGSSCQFDVVVAGGSTSQTDAVTPLAMAVSSPPATIVSLASASGVNPASTASLPAGDGGLTAPQLDELLPNPIGTGNDATNEFIELYNPNAKSFDLSGFTLQTGTTSTHSYTFPSGTLLAPMSFHAFYSSVSGLSLSNSGGQAKLLDPFGSVIGASDAYGTAKDGLTWALANGKWYWTTDATPNAANVIKQPAAKTSSKKTASKTKTGSGSVKGTSTSKSSSPATTNASDTVATTPIHPWVLALVAVAALLYGAYEYRTDLANRIYQLRRYLQTRREPRG